MKYYLAILEVTSNVPDPLKDSIEPDINVLMKTNTTVDLKIKVVNGLLRAKLLKLYLNVKYAIVMVRKKTNVIKYGTIIYDEPTAKKVLNLENMDDTQNG